MWQHKIQISGVSYVCHPSHCQYQYSCNYFCGRCNRFLRRPQDMARHRCDSIRSRHTWIRHTVNVTLAECRTYHAAVHVFKTPPQHCWTLIRNCLSPVFYMMPNLLQTLNLYFFASLLLVSFVCVCVQLIVCHCYRAQLKNRLFQLKLFFKQFKYQMPNYSQRSRLPNLCETLTFCDELNRVSDVIK